jgi:MFS transporter, DHA2 family, multidrug resistance protein
MSSQANSPIEDKPFLPSRHTGLLTAAVMAMTVCQFIDMTVANVALPHMQTSLNASLDTMSWALTSYIIAGVMITPLTGWLSDRFGSRNLYVAACLIFLVASALCGAATSLTQMVLFRALQGIGASFLGTMAQTIMYDLNPPSKQARAMSIWGMVVIIGPITGPFLGGFLTQNMSWRWVFFVNLPIGIPAIAILWWLMPSRPIVKHKLDIFGASMLALGLCSLQLMLDRGQHKDWFNSTEIVTEFVTALSAFWMFYIHNRDVKQKLFPTAMMANSNFIIGTVFMALMGISNVALSAVMPSLLQQIYHYDVMDALIKRVDPRALISLGYFVAAYSLWMMSRWSIDMGSDQIILAGLVQGVGLGLVFMPMNMIAFSSLPPQFRTEGGTLMTLARNLGGSFGISVIVTMLSRNTQTSHADIASNVTSTSLPALDLSSAAASLGNLGGGLLSMINGEVSRQAAMVAYLDNFYAMFWLLLIFVPLSFFLKIPKSLGSPVEMTHD